MKFKIKEKVKIKELNYTKSFLYTKEMQSFSSNEVGIIQSYDESDNTYEVKILKDNYEYWFHEEDIMSLKTRGFEVINDEHRKHSDVKIQLPTRGDSKSAGYDFYSNETIVLQPKQSHLFWTDVKSFMLNDEVLKIYVRSSIGVKKGLMLKNTVGIIDSSYYSNKDNDGNIGICLYNNSTKVVEIQKGERIAQGVFLKYLLADEDETLNSERTGGFGSTGK